MLVPSLDVSWGGYTVTLTAIFGICTMVQWSNEWDYFINLSASDFPLLPQVSVVFCFADPSFVQGLFVYRLSTRWAYKAKVTGASCGEVKDARCSSNMFIAKCKVPGAKLTREAVIA